MQGLVLSVRCDLSEVRHAFVLADHAETAIVLVQLADRVGAPRAAVTRGLPFGR